MTAAAAVPAILSEDKRPFHLWSDRSPYRSRMTSTTVNLAKSNKSRAPQLILCPAVSSLTRVEAAVHRILADVTPTAAEREVKRCLFNSLAHLLRHTFGLAVGLFIAGSTAYDVDSLKSDMDVVVFAHWAKPREVLSVIEGTIRATQRTVNAAACEWALRNAKLQLVDSAKVPILSIRSPSGIECDVSVNTNNSLRHTEFFKGVLTSHPNLRPVMRLLKHWVKARQLPTMREGGLPSLVWMMLAVHFCDSAHAQDLPADQNELLDRLKAVDGQNDSIDSADGGKSSKASIASFSDFPDPLAPFRGNSEFSCQLCADNSRCHKTNDKSAGPPDVSRSVYIQACPLFLALVAFFGRLATRQHLTRYVGTHTTRSKSREEVEARILGPMSHGGVLDELLTVEDPATAASSVECRLNKESGEVLRCFTDRMSPFYRHCAINGIPVGVTSFHSAQLPSAGPQTTSGSPQNDLASRVTAATWLVYQLELARAHRILGSVISSISDFSGRQMEENLTTLFKQNRFAQRYKLPAVLHVPRPIWHTNENFFWASSLSDNPTDNSNEGGVMVVVVLLEGRLVICRVENICSPWDAWWSQCLNRRDARTIIHGVVLSPVAFRASNDSQKSAAPICAWLAESKCTSPLLFKPCNFVMRLSVVSLINDKQQIILMLINHEWKRLMTLEAIAAEAPWHHSRPMDNSMDMARQPCSTECRVCGVDGMSTVRDAYSNLPAGITSSSTEFGRNVIPSVAWDFAGQFGGQLPTLLASVPSPTSQALVACEFPSTISSDLLPTPSVETNAAGDQLLTEEVLLKLEDVGQYHSSPSTGFTSPAIGTPGPATFQDPTDFRGNAEMRHETHHFYRHHQNNVRPKNNFCKNKNSTPRRGDFSTGRRDPRKVPMEEDHHMEPPPLPPSRSTEASPSQRYRCVNLPLCETRTDEPPAVRGQRRKDIKRYIPPACRSDDIQEQSLDVPPPFGAIDPQHTEETLGRSASFGRKVEAASSGPECLSRTPKANGDDLKNLELPEIGGARLFRCALQSVVPR